MAQSVAATSGIIMIAPGLSKEIARRREALKLSRNVLGRKIGWNGGTIREIEEGKRRSIQPESLAKIAKVLGTSSQILLESVPPAAPASKVAKPVVKKARRIVRTRRPMLRKMAVGSITPKASAGGAPTVSVSFGDGSYKIAIEGRSTAATSAIDAAQAALAALSK